jgi:Anti-sigma-K factor rskA
MIDIHETAAPYAVDALDHADLVEYEDHLAGCSACQDELVELYETAAELSLLAQATPRSALRGSVLDAVRATSQISEGPSVGSNGGQGQPVPGTELTRSEEPDQPVDELAIRRRRRRSRVLAGLVAAVLAIAVGLGGVVYPMVQQRQAQVAQVLLEEQLYAAPDSVTTTTALPGGGRATFVASRQLDRAVFVGTDLPDPGPNRYQLWTVTGSNLDKPTGVFRDAQAADPASEVKLFFSGNIAEADFLAVNLEPAGGTSPTPTTPVLAVGPTT